MDTKANPICSTAECTAEAQFLLYTMGDARIAEERWLCKSHGEEALSLYESGLPSNSVAELEAGEWVHMEVDMVVVHPEQCLLYLRSPKAVAWLGITVGYFEAVALGRRLANTPFVRPLTFRAFADTIRALGARLQDVLVDHFDPSIWAFHAKLRLQQQSRQVIVDVRPSDAFHLAVEFAAPIFVAAHLLRKPLGEEQ